MQLAEIVKGLGYPSVKRFQDIYGLDNVTLSVFRQDREALGRFMTESIKIPKGATHVDMNTGQFYKEGLRGFIYWHNKVEGWTRCNRIGGLKGLQKIQFYEYDQN